MVMTAHTSRSQFSGPSQPGSAKPIPAAATVAVLSNPPRKAKAAPSDVEISRKAYDIWLSTGQEPGNDQEHWFQAEQQLSQN